MTRERKGSVSRSDAYDRVEVENLTKPVAAIIGKARAPSERSKSFETTRRFFCRQCSIVMVGVLAFLTAVTYLCSESKGAIELFDRFLNVTYVLISKEIQRIAFLESDINVFSNDSGNHDDHGRAPALL